MIEALQWMAGITFLVVGVSAIWRAGDWTAWLQSMQQRGREAALGMGAIEVLLGSFIVAFHPVWDGWAMLLTLIGWAAIVEGGLYLLFPDMLARVLRCYLKYPRAVLQVGGAVSFALGVLFIGLNWPPA